MTIEIDRLAIPERELQEAVLELAGARGWYRYHTYDSRRSSAGFPDLVLVRERIVFAELKSQKGVVRNEQTAWIERLRTAGAEVYLWRPSDWHSGMIDTVLR